MTSASRRAKQPAAAAVVRLIKVSAEGLLLPADATEWVAVYQPERELTWTRDVLAAGRVGWKNAVAAASKVGLCGWKGEWRAPSRVDYAHLIDDQLYGPAIDTTFFTVADPCQWEWTGTECTPPGCAWGVNLSYGFSDRSYQGGHGHVRAVRAGQLSWPLDVAA